jgi:hypothetical protein
MADISPEEGAYTMQLLLPSVDPLIRAQVEASLAR